MQKQKQWYEQKRVQEPTPFTDATREPDERQLWNIGIKNFEIKIPEQ